GLVHEEHFGLDDESAREADALLHATRKFLGVCRFKAIQTDCVERAQSAFAPPARPTPFASSGASTFSSTVSQGNRAKLWKTIATLGIWPSSGLPCHKSVPDDGCASPVSMRNSVDLPQPEGPSRAMILPGPTSRLVTPTT